MKWPQEFLNEWSRRVNKIFKFDLYNFTEEFHPYFLENEEKYSWYFCSEDCHHFSDCTKDQPYPSCNYGGNHTCYLMHSDAYEAIIYRELSKILIEKIDNI